MQLFRLTEKDVSEAESVFDAILATAEGALCVTGRRLVSLQAKVEVRDQLFDVLSDLADDPRLADVIVIDCDGFGGLEAVSRALGRLCPDERRAPVIMISRDCLVQSFPQRRLEPICLRAPVSSVALRLAMETILRDRFPQLIG